MTNRYTTPVWASDDASVELLMEFAQNASNEFVEAELKSLGLLDAADKIAFSVNIGEEVVSVDEIEKLSEEDIQKLLTEFGVNVESVDEALAVTLKERDVVLALDLRKDSMDKVGDDVSKSKILSDYAGLFAILTRNQRDHDLAVDIIRGSFIEAISKLAAGQIENEAQFRRSVYEMALRNYRRFDQNDDDIEVVVRLNTWWMSEEEEVCDHGTVQRGIERHFTGRYNGIRDNASCVPASDGSSDLRKKGPG